MRSGLGKRSMSSYFPLKSSRFAGRPRVLSRRALRAVPSTARLHDAADAEQAATTVLPRTEQCRGRQGLPRRALLLVIVVSTAIVVLLPVVIVV